MEFKVRNELTQYMIGDLVNIVIEYVKTWQLLSWIDTDLLDRHTLSANPRAITLLRANQDMINWDYLSGNPDAIYLLEANQ